MGHPRTSLPPVTGVELTFAGIVGQCGGRAAAKRRGNRNQRDRGDCGGSPGKRRGGLALRDGHARRDRSDAGVVAGECYHRAAGRGRARNGNGSCGSVSADHAGWVEGYAGNYWRAGAELECSAVPYAIRTARIAVWVGVVRGGACISRLSCRKQMIVLIDPIHEWVAATGLYRYFAGTHSDS